MKKIFLFLLMITLLLGVVSAESQISVEKLNIENIASPGQEEEFIFTITNLDSRELKLQLAADAYVGLPTSAFEYVFLEPNIVSMKGHETIDVVVTANLKEQIKTGKRYETFFTISSLNDVEIDETYHFNVLSIKPEDPVSISISEIPGVISPGSELFLILTLENNMGEDLNEVDLFFTSDIFEEQQTIQLFNDQKRTVEVLLPIDQTAAPEEHTLNVRAYYDDTLVGTKTSVFEVGISTDVQESAQTIDGFLHKTIQVTKSNKGNSIVAESFDYDAPIIQGWFTAYNVEPNSKMNGEKQWFFSLTPGEDYNITITIDYRPLIIAIIVIILIGAIAYFLFTKRVSIKKEVFKTKYGVDGLSEFKVLIHIKNNTNKQIKEVTLIDRLPKVIKPSTSFGTLHPTGIEKGEKGTRMMWKIPKLLNGEERIISYYVHPKMNIIGNLDLPKAVAKYKNQSKKIIKLQSNLPKISSGVMEKTKSKK
jgi:hypothetical protein